MFFLFQMLNISVFQNLYENNITLEGEKFTGQI